jgi:predicted transport protein
VLFAEHPQRLALYRAFRERVLALGDDVDIAPKKTQVTFRTERAFAWAWLPQLWNRSRPDGSITISFDVDHPVHDARIAETVATGNGRWTHHIVIEHESDLDDVVDGWLAQAYAWAEERATRRSRR